MPFKTIKFWMLFAFLNCLLFLPKYILEFNDSSFLPTNSSSNDILTNVFNSIFIRYNFDIFRISIDLILLVTIFSLFQKYINIKLYSWISAFYFTITFLFIIYFVFFEKLYLVKPVLYDDIYLLKLGFGNAIGNFWLGIIIEFATLAIIIWMIKKMFFILYSLLKNIKFGIKSKIVFGIFGLLFICNTIRSGITFEPHHEFQSSIFLIIDNLVYSAQARENLKSFDVGILNKKMNYDKFRLAKCPNVYFLFVESYGKIVTTNEKLKTQYQSTIKDCDDKLKAGGFYSCSNFSTSPVSGGGSWISYSTVMFGFNLKNQATYLSLLKNSESYKYNHMFRWFKKNGYRNYRITALPENENVKIPWDKYIDFYGADKWLRYEDMNYKGQSYGFGPSPPDQFTISFANQYIQNERKDPFTLFFITQNSHHPFPSPDSVVIKWQSLNNSAGVKEQSSELFKESSIENYGKAINYDLKALVNFITTKGKENDIFILIGDHQPPFFTIKTDGLETPVHIISRDRRYISGFANYGFTEGLLVSAYHKSIKHEAFYSLFLRELIHNYGTDTLDLPKYLPQGIQATDHE